MRQVALRNGTRVPARLSRFPSVISTANTVANPRRQCSKRLCVTPSEENIAHTP